MGISDNLTVDFVEPMDLVSIDNQSFLLRAQHDGLRSGSPSYTGSTQASLDPTGALPAGERITATLTTDIENAEFEPIERGVYLAV